MTRRPQQQAMAGAPPPAAAQAAAAPAEDDPFLVIQKLAVLKDQGILTEGQFSAKKAQILGL